MRSAGYSLPELLLVMGLLGVVGSLSVQSGGDLLARQRLEAATRSLEQGINRARAEATKRQRPCGMQLAEMAWQAPPAGSDLEPCFAGSGLWPQGVRVQHNFPALLRFTSSGLVLDGGMAVLRHPGTDLERCMVMGLPLGVARLGRLGAAGCAVDPRL